MRTDCTRNIPRRLAVLGCAASTILPGCARAHGPNEAQWQSFKDRFLSPEGRIVDNGNGGISHSEGQGWGLFLAAAFDDRPAFQRILDWTQAVLRRPNDALHVWRYAPDRTPPTDDPNNSTDGDLFIGAALARAGRRWRDHGYSAAAASIGRDVLRLLVRIDVGRALLLPGAAGFETAGALVVNPSYYAFPFISEIESVAPSPTWQRLRDDGLGLIEVGRFGPRQLPPDWLSVDRRTGRLSAAPGWPARFSFDAIRIPLYLAWVGVRVPGLDEALGRFWGSSPGASFPAWADLTSEAVAPYAANPGIVAIARLWQARLAGAAEPDWPTVAQCQDYYSAVLTVLTRVAWREAATAAQPQQP